MTLTNGSVFIKKENNFDDTTNKKNYNTENKIISLNNKKKHGDISETVTKNVNSHQCETLSFFDKSSKQSTDSEFLNEDDSNLSNDGRNSKNTVLKNLYKIVNQQFSKVFNVNNLKVPLNKRSSSKEVPYTNKTLNNTLNNNKTKINTCKTINTINDDTNIQTTVENNNENSYFHSMCLKGHQKPPNLSNANINNEQNWDENNYNENKNQNQNNDINADNIDNNTNNTNNTFITTADDVNNSNKKYKLHVSTMNLKNTSHPCKKNFEKNTFREQNCEIERHMADKKYKKMNRNLSVSSHNMDDINNIINNIITNNLSAKSVYNSLNKTINQVNPSLSNRRTKTAKYCHAKNFDESNVEYSKKNNMKTTRDEKIGMKNNEKVVIDGEDDEFDNSATHFNETVSNYKEEMQNRYLSDDFSEAYNSHNPNFNSLNRFNDWKSNLSKSSSNSSNSSKKRTKKTEAKSKNNRKLTKNRFKEYPNNFEKMWVGIDKKEKSFEATKINEVYKLFENDDERAIKDNCDHFGSYLMNKSIVNNNSELDEIEKNDCRRHKINDEAEWNHNFENKSINPCFNEFNKLQLEQQTKERIKQKNFEKQFLKNANIHQQSSNSIHSQKHFVYEDFVKEPKIDNLTNNALTHLNNLSSLYSTSQSQSFASSQPLDAFLNKANKPSISSTSRTTISPYTFSNNSFFPSKVYEKSEDISMEEASRKKMAQIQRLLLIHKQRQHHLLLLTALQNQQKPLLDRVSQKVNLDYQAVAHTSTPFYENNYKNFKRNNDRLAEHKKQTCYKAIKNNNMHVGETDLYETSNYFEQN